MVVPMVGLADLASLSCKIQCNNSRWELYVEHLLRQHTLPITHLIT